MPGSELHAVEQAAALHGPGAAVVSSCQRIEVLHQLRCECGAPFSVAGIEAVHRLAEVAAGLDSLVLGEEQVMGQVRAGVSAAGADLQLVAGTAIAAARQLRIEADFSATTGRLLDHGLAQAGVAAGGRIAIAGAGPVGRLVAARAVELGFGEVVILGRREPDGAWFDAATMHFVPISRLHALPGVDVLVTCLGSGADPLAPGELPPIRRLVVDLGTPANITTADVPLVNIAMMQEHDAAGIAADPRRHELRARLRVLVGRRLEMARNTGRTPIGRLRQDVERVRLAELDRIRRLHPDLPETAVDTITRSLVQQIFHRPTARLRELADPELGERLAALFAPSEAPAGAPREAFQEPFDMEVSR